mgnify:FL=1
MSEKIKLFTDSASDLPEIYRQRYDVGVVPLTVIFGEREFKDGVTLSIVDFWKKLAESRELPSTNQAAPQDFVDAFEPYIKDGWTILYIGISTKLSGTVQSAHIAKELLGTDRIHIFDSKSASLGESLLVITAGELLQRGSSLQEVLAQLEIDRGSSGAYFTIDSLTHLVKGGRLTKTQGLVGSMLKIKPILRITEEGTVEVDDKVRSMKKALQTLVDKAKAHRLDFSQRRVAVVHSYGAESVDELKALVQQELKPSEIVEGLIGPTVGTHAGPGGLALFF